MFSDNLGRLEMRAVATRCFADWGGRWAVL
jgi:hypothetical protein